MCVICLICVYIQALISEGPDVMGRLSNHWVLGMFWNEKYITKIFQQIVL